MTVTMFSLAVLGSNLLVPVSDHVPALKVEALCQVTTADDKAMGLSEPQSFSDCMRDETDAQQQLRTLWQATAISLRDRCEGEAVAGDSQSYVDLLTCIQMAGSASTSPAAPSLRGGSKNRNKK